MIHFKNLRRATGILSESQKGCSRRIKFSPSFSSACSGFTQGTSHNKSGFSFIEIVVTVLMFGILVTSLMLSVTTTYNSVWRYSNKLERIFLLKQRLFTIFFDREQGKDKPERKIVIDKPSTTIMYEQKKPRTDSALGKFKNVSIQKLEAQWQQQESELTEQLVSFVLTSTKDKA